MLAGEASALLSCWSSSSPCITMNSFIFIRCTIFIFILNPDLHSHFLEMIISLQPYLLVFVWVLIMWYNTICSSFRCSLGDVTSDDKCYEKAQEVSGNKSARAQVNQNVLLPTLVIAIVFLFSFFPSLLIFFWDPNSFL